jgi:undecaprenyl-diphosphatase
LTTAVLVLLFAEVTDNVVDHDGLTAVDRPWHWWAVEHRAPVLTPLMEAFSTIGDTVVLAALAALVTEWLVVKRRRADAVLVAATTVGAAVLVPLIKNLVARPRPPVADRLVTETNWSYPSGHSLGATAVLGVLTVVLVARLVTRVARVLAVAAAVVLVGAIGVSRVYLGVHWPSDVLAGWLVGGWWLAICHALTSRWRRSNPVGATLEPATSGGGS